MRGITAKESCRLRTTWERMRSLLTDASPISQMQSAVAAQSYSALQVGPNLSGLCAVRAQLILPSADFTVPPIGPLTVTTKN